MTALQKRGITEIDPEIRELIIDLNKRGYTTVSSCAGHLGSPLYENGPPSEGNGYVLIKGRIPNDPWERMNFLEKIIPLFKKHGCKVTDKDNSIRKGEFSISFKPLGLPWNTWLKTKEFKKQGKKLIFDIDLGKGK